MATLTLRVQGVPRLARSMPAPTLRAFALALVQRRQARARRVRLAWVWNLTAWGQRWKARFGVTTPAAAC